MTGVENLGLEKAGSDYRVGNHETGKRGASVSGVENAEMNSMERRKYKNEHNRTVNKYHRYRPNRNEEHLK